MAYCKNCGREVSNDAYMCPSCGAPLKNGGKPLTPATHKRYLLGAAFLALTFGTFGFHDFYMGFDNKGYAKMLITVLGSCVMVGPLISMVWSWIDAIQILQGKAVDANGNPLE